MSPKPCKVEKAAFIFEVKFENAKYIWFCIKQELDLALYLKTFLTLTEPQTVPTEVL